MLGLVLRAFGNTLSSRRRQGPLYPGWSFSFEVFTRVLALRSRALDPLSLPERRRLQDKDGDREARRMRRAVERREATVGGVPGEWFTPRGKSPARTILYLHGGGFMEGSSRTHAEMLMRLALESDARLFAPNYRLAPEHPFPAQLDDTRAVYRALLADGVRPEDLVVAGDSAGGNLTIVLLASLRDAGEPLPSRAAALSPWTDLPDRSGSLQANASRDWAAPEDFDRWVAQYVGSHDPRNPLISPAYADLHGFPPLRVEVGTAEMLLDQVRAFADRARKAGVPLDYREHDGMVHDCYLFAAYFQNCKQALCDLATWIRGTSS
ncbi:alpha/beta hydrolase [Polyangium aurulentum]|uniref:alpha/beta hydrolase n=1 Tax=Polyangium aurulentum TaxID=2567896 RepID=UPI00146A303C|nr:alpha/beta hydrolase [Polyangium aurulentum]UQA63101.1 alpha/beta hydrolase [Polyangium aurulentum]